MADESNNKSSNKKSVAATGGVQRSPNRAMLRAVGFGDDDFRKPIVGVANGTAPSRPATSELATWQYGAKRPCERLAPCHIHSAPSPLPMDLDGDRGHEVFPGLPRSHCRLH